MASTRQSAPTWFTIVAVALILWGAMGVASCVQQIRLGAEAMGPSTAYDRALFSALPGWYNPLYAVTVGTGALGAVALFLRSRVAQPLFAVSLAGVVLMFGWMFVTTDLIAVKGVAVAAGFPLAIFAIGAFQLWLAGLARRRGWIG